MKNNKLSAKPIIQYDLNMNKIKKWDYIRLAANILKINETSIVNCAKKRRKTAGGYI